MLRPHPPNPHLQYVLPLTALVFWDQIHVKSSLEEDDSDFELLLPVLSCHADGGLRLSRVPVELQAAKHNDQRWLTVISHTLNGFVNFLTWIIAVIVVFRSWGADTGADSTTGELPQPCWVSLLSMLGLRPCPYQAEVILSHQVRQRKSFPRPYLTDLHWSLSPGTLCISCINRVWLTALASHHV